LGAGHFDTADWASPAAGARNRSTRVSSLLRQIAKASRFSRLFAITMARSLDAKGGMVVSILTRSSMMQLPRFSRHSAKDDKQMPRRLKSVAKPISKSKMR
jgi:hypothetical protein